MFHSEDMSGVAEEMNELKSKYAEQNERVKLFVLSMAALETSALGLKGKIEALRNDFAGIGLPKIPWATSGGRGGRGRLSGLGRA